MKQENNNHQVSENELKKLTTTLIHTLNLTIFNVVLGSHTTEKTLSLVKPAIYPMFYTFQALESVNMILQNSNELEKIYNKEELNKGEVMNLLMMAINTAVYLLAIEGAKWINPVLESYAPTLFSASLVVNVAHNLYQYYNSNSDNKDKMLPPIVLQSGLVPIVYFTLSKFASTHPLGSVKISQIGGFFGFLWTGLFISKNLLSLKNIDKETLSNDAKSLGGEILNGLASVGKATYGIFGGTVRCLTGTVRQVPERLPINVSSKESYHTFT